VARKPRQEVEPGISHVFARGNNRQAIFLDDFDRERYLRLTARVVAHCRWRCLSYCLMDNHVHLLVETREPNLGAGMQWLHGQYVQAFNRRHSRRGHLFGERFGSVRVESDAQLLTTVRYIARNPVEAALCSEAAEWRWSSHTELVRDALPAWMDVARLWELLSAWGGEPRHRYLRLVNAEDTLGCA
jgi:putative transposase